MSHGTDESPQGGEVARIVRELLRAVGEDPTREGLQRTPLRAEKSWAELLSGRTASVSEVIGNGIFHEDCSEMVLVKDIEFYSLCEHHLLPFYGRVHVGYIPDGRIIGLSKIPRLVDLFARRLQVQERLTMQVAETINEKIRPKGVAVVIEAQHLCMIMRGVEKQNSIAVTSSMLGAFKDDQNTRGEFLNLVQTKSR